MHDRDLAPRHAEVETLVALSLIRGGFDTSAARYFQKCQQPIDRALLKEVIALLEPGAPPDARAAALVTDARRHLDAARGKTIGLLAWGDPAYPQLLGHIVDPPLALWTRGNPEAFDRPAIAVVGSRSATSASIAVARRLGRDLAAAGIAVVSGLARGVDGAAHEGALDAGGMTIAVLGCGADVTYPAEHANLAVRVVDSGMLISELPPGTPPLPSHFPLRNRIISGLSTAVVVVEAGDRSGSLITARMALEQGRDVLAVPGGVGSGRYRGSHALIKDGARLVETVEDVLQELGWGHRIATSKAGSAKSAEMSDLEKLLSQDDPSLVEDLAHRTGRPARDVLVELGLLELEGRVARQPGGGYVRLD